MVQQDQFESHLIEDPNTYLANFLKICDTIKFNGVSDNVIKLRLFSISLCDKAKVWLYSYVPNIFIN